MVLRSRGRRRSTGRCERPKRAQGYRGNESLPRFDDFWSHLSSSCIVNINSAVKMIKRTAVDCRFLSAAGPRHFHAKSCKDLGAGKVDHWVAPEEAGSVVQDDRRSHMENPIRTSGFAAIRQNT